MAFGFAGAHRTGKTSLAQAVAKKLDLPFFEASFSRFASQLGVNAVGNLPIEERIDLQTKCLDLYVGELTKQPKTAITDRTPLDMIGYMLGEITMHNTSPEQGELVKAYVERCLHETSRHFDTIIVTRPLPTFVADPKSAPPNPGYQLAVQFLIEGAFQHIRRFVLEAALLSTDFEQRLDASVDLIKQRIEEMQSESRNEHLH